MKIAWGSIAVSICRGLLMASWLLILPMKVQAQGTTNAGNNAVYNSSSVCCIGSSAFIDALGYDKGKGFGVDICDVIYGIFTNRNPNNPLYPAGGAVIDARGINSINSSLTCTQGSPWNESGSYVSKPSTILLPAGTIQISTSWVLPGGTHLIGEGTTGANDINASAVPTTIQDSGSLTSGAMLQFGDATHCPSGVCTDISVEQLTLDGNNQSVTGILNENSQDRTFANHITLYRVLGTGLSVGANPSGGNAQNSGPYEKINYDTGSSGVRSSVCASINGLTATHGIHGLSCVSSPDASNAVLLDSSNNTIEDVRINGFYEGIVVGSQAAAHSNVLRNVLGDTGTGGFPVIVIDISNNNLVTDLVIMGVSNTLSGQLQSTIDDQVTSTPLHDSYVAMYALGESKNSGYTRYTTSPDAATWAFGNSTPATGSSCSTGSLYSCIGGTANCTFALYGCVGGAWSGIK